MADTQKITTFTESTAPVADDILVIVDDVPGVPVTRKVLLSRINSNFITTTAEPPPTNFNFIEGDLRRYGSIGNGVADDTAAFVAMLSFPGKKRIPKPTNKYKIDAILFAGLSDMIIHIDPGVIIEANTGFGLNHVREPLSNQSIIEQSFFRGNNPSQNITAKEFIKGFRRFMRLSKKKTLIGFDGDAGVGKTQLSRFLNT